MIFQAIACDSLQQASMLTAAEEAELDRVEEDFERSNPDLELSGFKRSQSYASGEPVEADVIQEDKERGLRPILPYSSLFFLPSTNP